MRVVIDTSVFLAAVTNESEDAWKILNLLERRHIIPVFNEASWEELCYMTPFVVAKYRGIDYDAVGYEGLPEDVRNEIDLWMWAWEHVYCPHRLMVDRIEIGDYIADVDDEMIVAAALDGGAWFIIHDDCHFDEVPPLIAVPDGHEVLCCRPGEFAAHFPDFLPVLRKKLLRRLA